MMPHGCAVLGILRSRLMMKGSVSIASFTTDTVLQTNPSRNGAPVYAHPQPRVHADAAHVRARLVVEPVDGGSAREGARGRIPELGRGELPVLVALDHAHAEAGPARARPREGAARRRPPASRSSASSSYSIRARVRPRPGQTRRAPRRASSEGRASRCRRSTMPAKVPGQSARRPPRIIERPTQLFRNGDG
jgi:hypothetical protein